MKAIHLIIAGLVLSILPAVTSAWYGGPMMIQPYQYSCPPPCAPHYGGPYDGYPGYAPYDRNCTPYGPYYKRFGPQPQRRNKYSGILIKPPYEGSRAEVVPPPPGNYSGIIIGDGRR